VYYIQILQYRFSIFLWFSVPGIIRGSKSTVTEAPIPALPIIKKLIHQAPTQLSEDSSIEILQ